MEIKWEERDLIGKLPFSRIQGFQTKLDHSQLPMQKKRKLEKNALKFLGKVFIRLQKE